MLLSIITAVYNGQDYLKECIESVLRQTYRDFEYIIVNDGSTDDTKVILDSIEDNRVTVIHSPKNNGAAFSLNLGIERAKGKWISIQDADDISRPEKIEEQLNYLENKNGLIGVSSLIKSISGNNGAITDYMLDLEAGYNEPISKETMYERRFYTCYLCHGTVIFPKEAFTIVGGYNTSYKISYDYDLWLRLFEIMPIDKVQKVLYEYRVNTNSLTNNNLALNRQELLIISSKRIREMVLSKVKKEPKFTLISTNEGRKFFSEKVIPNTSIHIKEYVNIGDTAKLKQIPIMINENEIDAVLVMNNQTAQEWVRRLKQNGLIVNKNLFQIWNYEV